MFTMQKQKSIRKAMKLHYRVIVIISLKGSSGGSYIFPLTTDAVLAFSHPSAIWHFPSQLVRWLYKLTSQVACKGLLTKSLRSTSISSVVTPDCIWLWVLLAYQLVNCLNYKQERAVNQKKSATTLDKTVEKIAYLGSIFLNTVAVTDFPSSPPPGSNVVVCSKESLIPECL